MREWLRPYVLLVRFPFEADFWRTTASTSLLVVSQLAVVASAFVLRTIANDAVGHRYSAVTSAVVVLCGFIVLNYVGRWVAFVISASMTDHSLLALDLELAGLTGAYDGIEHYERPEYLDRITYLRDNKRNLTVMPTFIGLAAASAIRLIVTVVVLVRIQPLLALLPIFALPSLVASRYANKRLWAFWDPINSGPMANWRQQNFLFRFGLSEPAGREIRVFGMQDTLQERFSKLIDEVNGLWGKQLIKWHSLQAAAWSLFACGVGAMLLVVVHDSLSGQLSAGNLVLIVTLTAQVNVTLVILSWSITATGNARQTAERLLWLRDFAKGTPIAATSARPTIPRRLERGIDFEHVSFHYPGLDKVVLRDLSLHLPAGSTVAIVGDNGAGKTTLTKLLLGMYRPSEGRILIDGVDLSDLDIEQWRARSSATFQDFARFELVAQRSVGLGDLPRLDDPDQATTAFEHAQATDLLDRLPHGLSTQLGLSFTRGSELSGGEWQKVAIGHAMMRDEQLLLILDEPAASLDAKTEAALFDRYAEATRTAAQSSGAVTVLISHRFSTVKTADLIVVVGDGTIAESGTHEELLDQDGAYASLFRLQAAAYQ